MHSHNRTVRASKGKVRIRVKCMQYNAQVVYVIHVGVGCTYTHLEVGCIQCSPPNSNLWGAQNEFDLSVFFYY